jgi:hypothetical protein
MQWLFVRKPLVRLGVVSYALYLYHWPVMQFYRKYPFKPIAFGLVVVLIPLFWAVGELSHKYFERPIRRMGVGGYLATLRPAVRRTSVAVSVASMLAAVAFLVTAPPAEDVFQREVTQSLRDSGGIVDGESVGVVVLGDSISALLSKEYRDLGYTVDAVVARSFAEGSGMAKYLVETEQVTDAIVMHLGSNEVLAEDKLRETLIATSALRRVVMTTLWREGWGPLDRNNALIRSMADEFPNLVVVDWYALAASDPATFVAEDGVHVARGQGVTSYIALIKRAVEAPTGGVVIGPS